MRILPLLFVCAFPSAVLAQNTDLRASLSMPPTALFITYPADPVIDTFYGYAIADGALRLINAGTMTLALPVRTTTTGTFTAGLRVCPFHVAPAKLPD